MAAISDLPRLTAAISAALTEKGIPHAVSGAMAMGAHGYVRATSDLDLLVAAPAVLVPEVFAALRALGMEGDDRELIQSLRENYFAELKSGPVRVEVLVPAIPYHHDVLRRAVPTSVAGQDVPVVTVEDLIILKLLWHRTKDQADVQALLSTVGVDEEYLCATLAGLLPADDPRHAELASLIERYRR